MYGFTGISVVVVFRAILVLLISLNLNQPVRAQETSFHSRNIFLKSTACEHCAGNLKDPVERGFKGTSDQKKILLFIDPQCPWCNKAIEDLANLKQKNSHWAIQVYVMGSLKEFMDYFRAQGVSLPQGLDYTLDFKNALADQYEISQTPSYIIEDNGKTKKVEGYVDLLRFNLDANY